jgi:hypothetical protein
VDAVKKVQGILESMIDESNSNPTKKVPLLQKYLRFWRMMKVFTQINSISRSDLIRNIFLENPGELDEYENLQIISYWQRNVNFSKEKDAYEIENRVNLSSLVVVPNSFRLRISFQLILSDHRMNEQHLRAEWNLKKELLIQKKLNIVVDFNRIQNLRKDMFAELMKIMECQKILNESVGEEEIKKQIRESTKKWQELNRRVEKVESLLNDIDKVIYKE